LCHQYKGDSGFVLPEKAKENNSKIQFNASVISNADAQIWLQDMQTYLSLLKDFFPLHEPDEQVIKNRRRLFIRILSHPWEVEINWVGIKKDNQQLHAFAGIMKKTRNWAMHSDIFDFIEAADMAFLFMVNMRAMFGLDAQVQPYEKRLLSLFKSSSLNEDDLQDQLLKSHKVINDKINRLKRDELRACDQAVGQAYGSLLDNYQKCYKHNQPAYFLASLYRLFWFETSPYSSGKYQINSQYSQGKKYDFFPMFASSIYAQSFKNDA
jgi:hypothetical protein